MKIRINILAYAEKKLVRPLTLGTTNIAYSPSKAMSQGKMARNTEKEEFGTDVYLRDIFLTREEYKDVARSIKSNFPLKLQKWIEEMEKKLAKRRKELRNSEEERDSDEWLNINEPLFKTELTAGDAVCWRILKWFLDGEDHDDDYLIGQGSEPVDPNKQKIVDEILALQKKNRRKKKDLMLLLAFLKSMDPLFRDAKRRVLDSRDQL